MRVDFFYRLPPPTALLLVSSILDLTSAHVLQQLPRRTDASTTTIPYHALTVVSWPLTPTPPPRDLFALRRRQDNTICGYIDGSSEFPATCSAGSHCVLDTEANVVGCCPNGEAACTAGVFTGCVDANSGPQTEVNPYVFSCRGDSVCFKNVFEGGFSQFGCGTASDQGTVVVPNASGISMTISYPTITASLTASVSTLSEPTTLGTVISTGSTRTSSSSLSPTSSSTSSSISSTTSSTSSTASSISSTASSISSTTSSSASSTISTSPTSSAASLTSTSASTGAPAASPANDPNRTGAIVGGTIGGLAVLIALVALIVFLIRRKQKPNVREGPGQGGSIRGTISTPKPGPGTGFTAISQDSDAYETGPGPLENPMFNNGNTQAMRTVPGANPLLSPLNTMPPMPFQNDVSPADETSPFAYGGAGMAVSAGASSSRMSYPPSELYGQYPPIYGIANTPVMHGGIDNRLESDQVPLTREIDDFSQGFSAALGRIGEEDEEEDLGDPNSRGMMMTGGAGGGFGESGDNNPMTTEDAQMSAATSSMYSRGSSARPLWQQNRRQSRNQMWM